MAKMYADEQEKTAGAEVQQLFDQMSVAQLEQVLGIEKKAFLGISKMEPGDFEKKFMYKMTP